MALLTLLLLIAPVYAHLQIRHLVAGTSSQLFTHALLLTIGAGIGWAALQYASAAPESLSSFDTTLVFVSGFAAAHIPAASIALIKRIRQAQGVDPNG